MEHKGYLLDRRKTGCLRACGKGKLSREDVTQIRRWVRMEGFGMLPIEQARALLRPDHPLGIGCWAISIAEKTLLDVINNRAWFDPTYDPSIPLFLPLNAPPEWLAWFLSLIVFWRTLCSVPSSAGSALAEPVTISN